VIKNQEFVYILHGVQTNRKNWT